MYVASFAGRCDNIEVSEDMQIVTLSKGETWKETISLFLEYCPSLQYSPFALHCTKAKYCQRINSRVSFTVHKVHTRAQQRALTK